MKFLNRSVFVLLLALALAACGNKGDLVLPDAPDPEPAAAQ
jgi:predicted small lipoprotein YifL